MLYKVTLRLHNGAIHFNWIHTSFCFSTITLMFFNVTLWDEKKNPQVLVSGTLNSDSKTNAHIKIYENLGWAWLIIFGGFSYFLYTSRRGTIYQKHLVVYLNSHSQFYNKIKSKKSSFCFFAYSSTSNFLNF